MLEICICIIIWDDPVSTFTFLLFNLKKSKLVTLKFKKKKKCMQLKVSNTKNLKKLYSNLKKFIQFFKIGSVKVDRIFFSAHRPF